MATASQILQEVRSAMAAVYTSRDGGVRFQEHQGEGPFESSPISDVESFYVDGHNAPAPTQVFGVAGSVEREWLVDVHLSHPAFPADEARDENVFRDLERVGDILENRTWTTSGIQSVFFSEGNVDKRDPNGWMSILTFRFIYVDTMVTA
jgi:hypothetical protein